MYEIIWHGRGGQGVVLAAQLLAEAAYKHGFKGVTATPTFGPERRGAPVTASNRISERPIRTFARIKKADIAVCLDETLFEMGEIKEHLKEGGILIVNTKGKPRDFFLFQNLTVAAVDAVNLAQRHHLVREGAPLVNIPMLGAFARVAGLITIQEITSALEKKISAAQLPQNEAALKAAFSEVRIEKNG